MDPNHQLTRHLLELALERELILPLILEKG